MMIQTRISLPSFEVWWNRIPFGVIDPVPANSTERSPRVAVMVVASATSFRVRGGCPFSAVTV